MKMTIVRTTLYLKTASKPATGTYQEEIGVVAGKQLVLVEFSALAQIKVAVE